MAFLKKEFKAIFKTYRWWVIPLVFLIFALMGPPGAKLTPQIIKSAMPQGMTIKVPDPTLVDAFGQWFRNLSQMGLFAAILLTMGIVAEEKASGTILLVVTKPVSRANFVLSKFFAQSVWLTFSLVLAAAVTFIYSAMIFKFDRLAEFTQANVLFILYYLVAVAITVFFSTVFKNQIVAGGLALITIMLLNLVSALSRAFDKYAPTGLNTVGTKLAMGQTGGELVKAAWPALTAIILIAALLGVGTAIFKREEL
jgi:ABC-2 type transport system permease protein